jgi:hypothetical protein
VARVTTPVPIRRLILGLAVMPACVSVPAPDGPVPEASGSQSDDGSSGEPGQDDDNASDDGEDPTGDDAPGDETSEPGSSEEAGESTTSDTSDPPVGCGDRPAIVGLHYDGEFNYATEFPISITFDDDGYATDTPIVWTDAGAHHEHVPDGGHDGCGAARIYPPSEGEHMAGIGQILGFRDVLETQRLSIRYCIAAGPTFPELSSGAKPIILWRADPATDEQTYDPAVGARPMVISRDDPMGRGITYGLCDGTVCTYAGGDFWPDGSDTWFLDASGWSCLEFDFDLEADTMQLYVSTDDGRFHDTPYLSATFRDPASGPGGVFTAIDTVGGYFAQSVSDPDNYYMIDDLVVDIDHIGPPAGFGE